jgi:large subunit ribosomal protein L24e
MAKCTFCGLNIEQGTGKMYVLQEGKVLYFCSGKCEKNMLKLKRKPLTTRWSTKYVKWQQNNV